MISQSNQMLIPVSPVLLCSRDETCREFQSIISIQYFCLLNLVSRSISTLIIPITLFLLLGYCTSTRKNWFLAKLFLVSDTYKNMVYFSTYDGGFQKYLDILYFNEINHSSVTLIWIWFELLAQSINDFCLVILDIFLIVCAFLKSSQSPHDWWPDIQSVSV